MSDMHILYVGTLPCHPVMPPSAGMSQYLCCSPLLLHCTCQVGDFGNGGQVILDQATFQAIKDDAQALGAVDASGLNHSKLSSGRLGWKRLLRMCGIERCVSGNWVCVGVPT